MNKLEIIGGGIAGLSLGIALRRSGIPVTLFEAGSYPRHKVCGEFMAGIRQSTLSTLGLDNLLEDAEKLRNTLWFRNNRPVYSASLPSPALAISRYTLDDRLSQEFQNSGGILKTHTRMPRNQNKDKAGSIWSAGRIPSPQSPWIGLKCHVIGIQTNADLELHLGNQGYMGISPVDGNRFNLCGLFQRKSGMNLPPQDLILEYMKHNGLENLHQRVKNAEMDPDSVCGVSALNFSSKQPHSHKLYLGDGFALIPPFTGNGMTLALESAETALPHLLAFALERKSWENARKQIRSELKKRFIKRLTVSRAIHPFVRHSLGQQLLKKMAQVNLLPFQLMYRLMH